MSKSSKVKVGFVIIQITRFIVTTVFIAVFVLYFTSFFSDIFYYMITPKPTYEHLSSGLYIFLDLFARVVYISIWGFMFAHIYKDDELIPAIVPPAILSIFSYGYLFYDPLEKLIHSIACNADLAGILSESSSANKIFFIPYLVILMISVAFFHKVLNKNKA